MSGNETHCRLASAELAGLSIFSALREHPLISAFLDALNLKAESSPAAALSAWAAFTTEFARYSDGRSFARVIYALALADVNVFTLAAERGVFNKNSFVCRLAANDILALSRVAAFDFKYLSGFLCDILCGGG
ncbi:MAG: hypothetical protein LBH18_01115, partial [Spirochaetaceae bacterium]|nr:hypothetical protein [Spirochaetaceae bacterium]